MYRKNMVVFLQNSAGFPGRTEGSYSGVNTCTNIVMHKTKMMFMSLQF